MHSRNFRNIWGRRPQGEKIEEEDRVRACRCRFFGFLSSNCQASRRSERALCSGWESCQTRSGSRNGRVEAGGNYRQDRRETLTDTVITDSGIPVKKFYENKDVQPNRVRSLGKQGQFP